MATSLKHMRGSLSGIGYDAAFAEALYNRCVAQWGMNWDFGPAGVVADGKLVVPAADYMAFTYGVKPVETVSISEPAPQDDEDDYSSESSRAPKSSSKKRR